MAYKQPYNKIYTPEKWEQVNKENKELIDDFITECKAKRRSEGTQKQYFADLRRVAIWVLENCDNQSFLDLNKRDFRRFMIYCQDEWSLSAARCNRMLSAVHMMLEMASDDDDLYEDYDRNASEKIKGVPNNPVREITFVSDEHIKILYDKLMKEERYKEATLLGILYDSGVRRNEVLQVKRTDIADDKNCTDTVVVGKRSKKFKVIYFSRTKEAFKKYEATRTDNVEALFINAEGRPATANNIYDWIKQWGDELTEMTGEDYRGLTCHSLRHCYIDNLLKGTHYLCKELNLGSVPLEKVKVLAHHENSDTTLKYSNQDENKDIEDLFGIKLQ